MEERGVLAQVKVAAPDATTKGRDPTSWEVEAIGAPEEELVVDDARGRLAVDSRRVANGVVLDAEVLERDAVIRPIKVAVHGKVGVGEAEPVRVPDGGEAFHNAADFSPRRQPPFRSDGYIHRSFMAVGPPVLLVLMQLGAWWAVKKPLGQWVALEQCEEAILVGLGHLTEATRTGEHKGISARQ